VKTSDVHKEAEGLAVAIAASEILRQLPSDPNAEAHRADLSKAMGWQCAIHTCVRQSRALGLCDTHYRLLRNLPRRTVAFA
jgi:hypothetical protein